MHRFLLSLLLVFTCLSGLQAQSFVISGHVIQSETKQPVVQADILLVNTGQFTKTDKAGNYRFQKMEPGTYTITAYGLGLSSNTQQVIVTDSNTELNFILKPLAQNLQKVDIRSQREKTTGITRLNSVEGTAIYEAKKSEVVVLNDITANLATNNSRQVFAKVAGLNIWESDGAGLQLGIGGRGLNPNRTTNFNTRQNGYDISADALGYPESYYTPPTEALDRIEVVRGAASLQYGTQFGGMVNFVMKKGPQDKPLEVTSRQTIGSFGLFNSFNSIGGASGKFNYYGFYQYKRGDGWRPNSEFDVHTAYSSVNYNPNDKLKIGFDYTYMDYLAKQPGGLTDRDFYADPQQSVRSRNWFKVNWNLLALTLDYRLNEQTKLNVRNFGLLAERNALGYLEKIQRPDLMEARLLLKDKFRNFGNETRLIHHYKLLNTHTTFLVGARYYHGFTDQKQGSGSAASDADFTFHPAPNDPDKSDYDYPSRNLAIFSENIFNITPKLSVTPGIRYEWINTAANGRYDTFETDLAGNVIAQDRIFENRSSPRDILLLGLGISYKQTEDLEAYANLSQNYRAINFNDMRVINKNMQIDPNLQDERGYSADLGFRGNYNKIFSFDVSFFHLLYANRISQFFERGTAIFTRRNLGQARHIGVESFVELDALQLFNQQERTNNLTIFANTTYMNTRYETQQKEINGNKVELAPELIFKSGISYAANAFKISGQYSFTGKQFTDASNAPIATADAVIGPIPAYHVMDISASYTYKKFTLESGINNLTDNKYFTRRATGYPGPGIIPSDARNYYLTLQLKL
jgi:Fe(3+) dicitrate transport protein